MADDMSNTLRFVKVSQGVRPPLRHSANAAGYDLATPKPITLEPKVVTVVPLGLKVRVPKGHYGM